MVCLPTSIDIGMAEISKRAVFLQVFLVAAPVVVPIRIDAVHLPAGLADDLLRLGPEFSPGGAGIEREAKPFVHLPEPVRGRFGERPEPLLALVPRPFRLFAPGDVDDDPRAGGDVPSVIDDRRGGQGNVDPAAVPVQPDCLQVVDALSPHQSIPDLVRFVRGLRWNQGENGLADDLFGRMAEHALGAAVPGDDDSLRVDRDDPGGAGFNDRRHPSPGLLGLLVLGDVPGEHCSLHDAAMFIEDRTHRGLEVILLTGVFVNNRLTGLDQLT